MRAIMPCVGNRASVARPANARIRRKGPTQNARGPCTRPRWSAATRGSRVSKPSCARSSRWRTRTLAAADLGLLDPVVYRPRHATDLRQDRQARLPTQSVPALIVEYPPHARFAHFTEKPVRCLAHDAPSCPEVEASGKSGAVRQSGMEIREGFVAVEDHSSRRGTRPLAPDRCPFDGGRSGDSAGREHLSRPALRRHPDAFAQQGCLSVHRGRAVRLSWAVRCSGPPGMTMCSTSQLSGPRHPPQFGSSAHRPRQCGPRRDVEPLRRTACADLLAVAIPARRRVQPKSRPARDHARRATSCQTAAPTANHGGCEFSHSCPGPTRAP